MPPAQAGKKAKVQPKKKQAQSSEPAVDQASELNKDLSKMRALIKYRASDECKRADLGLFSFRRIDLVMSHPCRAVDVYGVQETDRLLWSWGVQETDCLLWLRGVQEARRLLWLQRRR